MIRYPIPTGWFRYDGQAITNALAAAKATIISLRTIPYQKQWVERHQQMELKREVAGTSRIEGADFTEPELEEALHGPPEKLVTRSQRQARAAAETYRWIAGIPEDRPVTRELVLEIHRRIVTGADDDHCPPGVLRQRDENVIFGTPRHRGAEGGPEVAQVFDGLITEIGRSGPAHDPIVLAMAAHYHIAAIHPFLDGNGRTARALEALLLQRAGLRDTAFIAMSNYYYDEKPGYLRALAETRERGHDLTPFLQFALRGVEVQGGRLLTEIRLEIQKEVFRNMMYRLFHRLQTKRKRVIGARQVELLKVLLNGGKMSVRELFTRTATEYTRLKNPVLAASRDIANLRELGAIQIDQHTDQVTASVELNWPERITESEFYARFNKLPKGKSYRFLR